MLVMTLMINTKRLTYEYTDGQPGGIVVYHKGDKIYQGDPDIQLFLGTLGAKGELR